MVLILLKMQLMNKKKEGTRMGRRFRQLNNDGMTLVELLVALVILAAIVVPLLHTFISASSVNKYARSKLKVTTVAQDIMEGLKADTLEDLAYQFSYPDGYDDGIIVNDSFHLINKDLLEHGNADINEVRCTVDSTNGSVTGFAVASDSLAATTGNSDDKVSVSSNNAGKNYSFVSKAGGKYYYSLQNVAVQTVGATQRTDVLIEVDATKYREGGGISVNQAKLNETSMVDINDMNPATNAIYIEKDDFESNSLGTINSANLTSYALNQISKEANIVISKNASTGAVTVNMEHIVKVGSYSHTESNIIFDNTGKIDNSLEAIYIFYYPKYSGAANDKITVKNDSQVDTTVYLIKQQRSGSDATLNTDESGYHCAVMVNESGVSLANKHTRLRTNLDYNLFSLYDISTSTPPSLMTPGQATYYFNSGVEGRDFFGVETLGGKQVNDRMYDVRVYLYEEGSIDDALSSGNIAQDKLLIMLDGTMK